MTSQGALGMHSSANVQYIRPEIIGIVLGAAIAAAATREFRAKAGSSLPAGLCWDCL